MPKEQRLRWSGDPQILASALEPHCIKHGPSFLRYTEAARKRDARLEVTKLEQYKPMLSDLIALVGSTSVNKTTWKAVFSILSTKFKPIWKEMKDAEMQDWQETMVARCSNMVGHVQRTSKKRRRPQWYYDLGVFPEGAGGEGEKKDDKKGDESKAQKTTPQPKRQRKHDKCQQDENNFLFEWREDLLLARRMRGADGPCELSKPPTATDGLDTSPLVATWADGVSWTVPGWSQKRYKEYCNRSRGRPKIERLWEGVALHTSHELYLAQRVDRVLLMSLYEQSKQIAQLRIDLFGSLPGEQPAQVDNACQPVQDALGFFPPFCD